MRSGFEAERAGAARRGDRGMLAAVVLLAGVGVAALWSASSEYALSLGRGSGYFALRQAVFILPGALVFWACASVDLEALRAKTGALTLAALGLMLLPFVPGLGENRNGATRWIDLRFTTFQPLTEGGEVPSGPGGPRAPAPQAPAQPAAPAAGGLY